MTRLYIITHIKRGEAQELFSFLPLCPISGKVLEVLLVSMDKKTGKVIFKNGDDKIETDIFNGNCKLQWKVDWAMRWFTFDVDFEMWKRFN